MLSNLIKKIKAFFTDIFSSPSVASITNDLQTTVNRLNAHTSNCEAIKDINDQRIRTLRSQIAWTKSDSERVLEEAKLARKVASNIELILK